MTTETYFVDMPHMRKIITNPKFLSRVFSPQEMKQLMKKNFAPYSIAEMYCAKLAFKKAMGMRFSGCNIIDVSVLTDYSGSYYLSLSGTAKERFKQTGFRSNVSCAHSKALAMATVVFYE